jgi:hypothetical protein
LLQALAQVAVHAQFWLLGVWEEALAPRQLLPHHLPLVLLLLLLQSEEC